MSKKYSIYNAKIVKKDSTIENGSIIIEDSKIAKISENTIIEGEKSINAKGNYVFPGFIDIHSDSIEREIEARPGVYLATNIALIELDKKLAAAGITTIYHSVSFADEGVLIIRSIDIVESIIREIKRLKDNFLINTKIHARFEITNTPGIKVLKNLIEEGFIDLLSIMDHTPGQGQFNSIDKIKNYYGNRFGVNDEAIKNLVETRMSLREKFGIENAIKMMEIAKSNNIVLASHDDDTASKVEFVYSFRAKISEFPISIEAVKKAHEKGMYIALGSPNILRGYSHNKNLSSRDLISNGYGDIVCSDYIPSSLLHALFVLVDKNLKTLPEAVNMLTYNPAKALGIDNKTGSITEGLDADLIIVDNNFEIPRVLKTIVRGKEVFSICEE